MARRQNFKTRRTLNKIGKIALIILAVALGLGCISMVVANVRERNEDNLIEVNDTYFPTKNYGHGLEFDVDEDGVIKIKGEKATGSIEAIIQTVELDAGTYTLSGLEKPNQDEMFLSAEWGEGEVCIAGIDDANGTFTLTEKSTVTIVLHITSGTEIKYANRTIEPVLVEGDDVGEFWAKADLFDNDKDDKEDK